MKCGTLNLLGSSVCGHETGLGRKGLWHNTQQAFSASPEPTTNLLAALSPGSPASVLPNMGRLRHRQPAGLPRAFFT